MSAIRFGVIGTGFMGRTWAGVIARHVSPEDAVLTAVGGGRGAPTLAADHGVPSLDPGELIARDDIDAVIVATPVPSHRPHVVAAAQAGKHALAEKPMTSSVADAEAMVAAADASDVPAACKAEPEPMKTAEDVVERIAEIPTRLNLPSECDKQLLVEAARRLVAAHADEILRFVNQP